LSKWNFKSALEFALKKEEESIKLYTSTQEKVELQSSKVFLKELAEEEEKHKEIILQIMKGKVEDFGRFEDKIQDLKIVEYLADVSVSPYADYQQLLIYAAKREKAAHDIYHDLAKSCKEKVLKNLFTRLAIEELKHKNKLEKEYDDIILKFM
jgi:rubrerythrin